MNKKRFLLSVISIFVMSLAYDYLLHGLLLHDVYRSVESVWRSGAEIQSLRWVMVLADALMALLVTFVFTRRYEGRGGGEGVGFGLSVGAILAVPHLASYCFLPLPFSIVASWMAGSLVWGVLAGIVLALTYRKADRYQSQTVRR